MVLKQLELVDANPDPVVKKRSRTHRYRKFRKDALGRRMKKKSWMTDHCF